MGAIMADGNGSNADREDNKSLDAAKACAGLLGGIGWKQYEDHE